VVWSAPVPGGWGLSAWHAGVVTRLPIAPRHDPRHHDVEQVLLWSPERRRLIALRHGALPSRCPYTTGCEGLPARAVVLGLDLGAKLVAFTWAIDAPGVIGHLGYELRADRLDDGRSVLAGAGYAGEACTGGPDGVAALAPAVEGDAVWYLRATSTCYVNSYSLVRFDSRSHRAAFGALAGEILDLARDGGALYALVAPKPQGETPPACTPCTIERLDPPAMAPRHYEPHPPFF
jgi:hypothetical protein